MWLLSSWFEASDGSVHVILKTANNLFKHSILAAGRFWSIQEKAPLGDSVGALGSRKSASAICLPGNEAAACCVAGYTHAVVGTGETLTSYNSVVFIHCANRFFSLLA
jgi:hypothetical protein